MIDVSTALYQGMPQYPKDAKLSVKTVRGKDNSLISSVSLSAHSGTHVDAPAHYLKGGKTVLEVGLERLCGRAKVCDVTSCKGEIAPRHLQCFRIKAGDIVLLKTGHARALAKSGFTKDYPSLTEEAALYLSSKNVKAVGIDTLSIDAYGCDMAHRILLKSGIPIIEGLDMSLAGNGSYTFICLPLKFMGLEAAPARCVLLK